MKIIISLLFNCNGTYNIFLYYVIKVIYMDPPPLSSGIHLDNSRFVPPRELFIPTETIPVIKSLDEKTLKIIMMIRKKYSILFSQEYLSFTSINLHKSTVFIIGEFHQHTKHAKRVAKIVNYLWELHQPHIIILTRRWFKASIDRRWFKASIDRR